MRLISFRQFNIIGENIGNDNVKMIITQVNKPWCYRTPRYVRRIINRPSSEIQGTALGKCLQA